MKAIFGFLAFIVLIVLVVILIARGGNDDPATAPVPQLREAAFSDASFTFTDSGPILSEEEHTKVRIRVSRYARSVEVVQGYQNTVVASQSFNNNEEAFEEFLSALDRSGYTTERRTSIETEAGVCPNGHRYVFESNQFGEDFFRWTSSCRDTGNFNGRFNTIRQLFRGQIPEYNEFIGEARRSTGLRI